MSKAIVLYSGGLDSTTLLWLLRAEGRDVKALLVNYGQRHSIELSHAFNVCTDHGIEFDVANLRGISHLIRSGSQSGDDQPPEGHYAEMSMKTTIVPNRNSIMLSIAVGWAVATRCTEVYFAAHGGDHTIYPDCRPEFVDAFNKAMQLANAWSPVEVFAPFLGKSKADIVRLGDDLDVPFAETWSCYIGGDMHCGKCGTCVERKEAFQLADMEDPTTYATT